MQISERTYQIALVEDDGALRTLLTRYLRQSGFPVRGYATAAEFRASADQFDLVILDVVMPKMHGSEVSIKLREIDPSIPVLFVTGYDRELISSDLSRQPDTQCLQKPFKQQDLIQTVNTLIDTPAATQSVISN